MSYEPLEKLCMENTQILPWIWVIESLASSKSVDTSVVMQLAKMIPDKYGEMGKNAREAVSLRILEGLADRGNEGNDNISDTVERIEFDPSESCEDVLQHILEDAPASDVKNGGLKVLKWDVQSFIAGKRARLNTSFLQKLKDAILEGSHSALESLRERSGIAIKTPYIENIPTNGGQYNELVQRHEHSDENIEAVEVGRTSNFITSAEKCDDELQENEPVGNLLPAKRNRSHVTADDLERQVRNTITVEDCCDTERETAKKQKLAETEAHRFVESSVNMEEKRAYDGTTTEDCCDPIEADKKHKQAENCSRHVMITSSQHTTPVKPSEISMENVETEELHRLDKEAEVVASPNNTEDRDTPLMRPAKPVDKDRERNETNDQYPEATGDSEEYHDETSESNSMKNTFLSSRCPFSQDSLSTQLKLCMKCNNGGQVLVCSSATCPIVVHESCLGSTLNLDQEGLFYCPFCAYSRAISEYSEVKKRAILARKNLAIFFGQKVDKPGSDKSKINESKRDVTTNKQRFKSPCTKSRVDVAREASRVSDGALPVTKPKGVISPEKEKHFIIIRKESISPAKALHDPIESSGYESDQSVASTHNIKSTTSPNLRTYHARNKERIAWTSVEVEKLKEGVEKFHSVDGVIAWKKILEFGGDVFQKGRSGMDLKNKWRRILKTCPNQK